MSNNLTASNPWFKLTIVSLAGIILIFAVLWGINAFNSSYGYGNVINPYSMNSMQMGTPSNNQGMMNMQGQMNMGPMNVQGSMSGYGQMPGGMNMMQNHKQNMMQNMQNMGGMNGNMQGGMGMM